MKPLRFTMRPFKAAIVSVAIAGCGVPAHNSLPPVEVDVPSSPSPSSPEAPSFPSSAPAESPELTIPTRMTLLLTGDTFLAYVSVPDEGSWRDLEGANSTFYYKNGNGWKGVPGCESVFECDVSAVRIGNTRFKAVFKPEHGIYATAEATFP